MSILDYIAGSYLMTMISGRWNRATKVKVLAKAGAKVPNKRAKIKAARKQSRKDRNK